MVKDKSQFLPEDSSVLGKISDQECAELLREVYEKDWEQELTDFNARIMELRIDEAVEEYVNKKTGISNSPPLDSAKTEKKVVNNLSLRGGGILSSIILSFIAVPMMWLGGRPFFEGVFEGVFAALFATLIFMVFFKLREQSREKELTIKALRHFREQMDTGTISPDVMIQFWGEKIETYLHKKKKIVSGKIKETSAARAKCNGLASELRNYKDEESKFSLRRLTERGQELTAIIDDATKVNGVLQKIEDKFVCHITELQTLIERQEEMKRLAKRREELVKQANLLLDGTETALNDWDDGKREIQNELFGMMNAFQRELATTKDTIRIEMNLNNA